MKVFVLGPTGVGKTKLSVLLAQKLDAYIINCDAIQVYKYLDIGSAKVKEEEKMGIRHFLFDIKNPLEDYNVSDYQMDIRNIFDAYPDKNFVIVGGTGLYATASVYDYRFYEDIDIDLSNKTNEELYEMAKEKDSNINIDKNNRVRLERFLKRSNEVVEPVLLYKDSIFIGLTTSRDKLYEIINERVENMFRDGLIEEVKSLVEKYPSSKVLNRAIGYKEVVSLLNKEITLEEAKELIKKNSRHYAKRQYTWFNNKMDIKWFTVNFNDFNKTVSEVIDYIGVE